jgi:hypothetical protein
MSTKNETPILTENPTIYRFAGDRTQVLLSGEQTDGAFAMVSAGRALYLPRRGIHFVVEAGEPWDQAKAGSPITQEEIQRMLAAAPRHAITILK